MADEVDVFWQTLRSCLEEESGNNSKWNEAKNIFERLKIMVKDPDHRAQISSSNIDQTQQFLASCEQVLSSNDTELLDETLVSCLMAGTEALRFLRNSSASAPQNQEYIVTRGVIQQVIKITNKLLKPHFQESDERSTVNDTIKSAIQLIGNVTVGNTLTKEYIWKQCYPEFFLSVMTSASLQIQNCMCMVIYNCMTLQQSSELMSSLQGLKIMSQILHLCSDHEELEWGYFIVDSFVKNGHTRELYTGLEFDPSARIILLDLIQVHLADNLFMKQLTIIANKPLLLNYIESSNSDNSSQEPLRPNNSQWSVPEESLVFLADEFERTSDTFFQKEYDSLEAENMLDAVLIARLLSLLSKATALHLPALQNHIQLLRKALDLLHQTNEPQNCDRFSNTSSIPLSQDSGKLSPTHGFKRDLVRMIGNMCCQHRPNQEEVRIKEGIPLLLDHCNIDDHNPYICQWAVFAIHNLLENNIENQKIVAELDKQGLADNTRLNQFGVDIKETKDGGVKIVQKTKS